MLEGIQRFASSAGGRTRAIKAKLWETAEEETYLDDLQSFELCTSEEKSLS